MLSLYQSSLRFAMDMWYTDERVVAQIEKEAPLITVADAKRLTKNYEYIAFLPRLQTYMDLGSFGFKGQAFINLAKAGFFYNSVAKKIECFCCCLQLPLSCVSNTCSESTAWRMHYNINTKCNFIYLYRPKKCENSYDIRLPKQILYCVMCKNNSRQVMLLPCNHTNICNECCFLNINADAKCPECLDHIKQIVRVNFN